MSDSVPWEFRARRLAMIREARAMTLAEVAGRLGITRQQLRRMERGAPARPEMVAQWARVLSASWAEVDGGSLYRHRLVGEFARLRRRAYNKAERKGISLDAAYALVDR